MKLDRALADLESLKEQHQSTITSLQQSTARVEELEGIHAELQEAEHQASQARKELQSRFDGLLDTADKHKQACEELSRQNAKLQTDLDAAVEQNESLKEAPGALLEATAEMKTFSSRLTAALEDYKKLEAKLQDVQRNVMQLEAENAVCKEQRDTALKAVDTSKAQIARMEETHATTLQKTKSESQKQRVSLDMEVQKLKLQKDHQQETLNEKHNSAKRKLEEVRQQLKLANEEARAAEQAAAKANLEKSGLMEELKQDRARHAHLQEALQAQASRNGELESEVQVLRADKEEQLTKIEELKDQATILRSKVVTAERTAKDTENQHTARAAEAEALANEQEHCLATARQEIEELQEKLSHYTDTADSVLQRFRMGNLVSWRNEQNSTANSLISVQQTSAEATLVQEISVSIKQERLLVEKRTDFVCW